MRFVRTITGYREDLDLGAKWWHRLLSVIYVVTYVAAAAIATWLTADRAVPMLDTNSVVIRGSLESLFDENPEPGVNLAQRLFDMPGEVGILRDDGSIGYVNGYYVQNSFCTANSLKAADAIAKHLNRVNDTTRYTADLVISETLKDVKEDAGHCWLRKEVLAQLGDEPTAALVSYEISPTAKPRAVARAMISVLAVLVATHLLLLTMYYRGLVYVVCSPRRSQAGQALQP